jgi:hypothetical protein
VSDLVTIGRVVLYRSRTGSYTVPALVNCTARSLNPAGVEAGHVPPLSSEQHVHLSVLTPGKPGKRAEAEDFVVESQYPVSENVGGMYQEWDIPFWSPEDQESQAWEGGDYGVQPPGTWAWPQRL